MFKILIILLVTVIVTESHTPMEMMLRQYFTNSATTITSSSGGGLSGGPSGSSGSSGPFAGAGPLEQMHNLCYSRCRQNGNFDCDCHEMCFACDMICGDSVPAGRQAPPNVPPTTTATTTTRAPGPAGVTPAERCLARCQFWGNRNCESVCSGCGLQYRTGGSITKQ